MKKRTELEIAALMAARDYGIGSILFRNILSRKFSLNLTESLCLTVLGMKGSSTPTELAQFTGLTTGATTTMLDRLEKRGFISRTPNPEDRRGVIIKIEDSYAHAAREQVEGIQKSYSEVLAKYTDEQLDVIRDFLNGFTQSMKMNAMKIDEDAPWL